MNGSPQKNQGQNTFSLAFVAVFVAWTVCECWLLFHKTSGEGHRVIFLLVALVTTLVSQSRSLPLQNVLLAAAIIGLIGGIVELIGAASGIPFGSRIYLDESGPQIFGILPGSLPVFWIVFLLNSRGVARLMLRPWRKSKTYGFRVIGLTCLLVVALNLGFEPFASRANHFWIWQARKNILSWHDAPWVNFFSVGLTALLILAFATPSLINKNPASSKRPPDYQPMILWLTMNLYFALANGVAGLSLAMIVGLALSLIAAIFAVRGARW